MAGQSLIGPMLVRAPVNVEMPAITNSATADVL
jgi:hypothetical protein